MYTDKEVTIRPIEDKDLIRLWELMYKEEAPEWKKWDAPYFPHKAVAYDVFLTKATSWINEKDIWGICLNDELIGVVTYYFEDQQKHWLELGIVIHEGQNWGKGIGTRALKMWMDHVFQSVEVARVGLTTWSGNARMIRAAEKLGMQMEARIRKVRFYEGEYYDSIRMGILREEWQQ